MRNGTCQDIKRDFNSSLITNITDNHNNQAIIAAFIYPSYNKQVEITQLNVSSGWEGGLTLCHNKHFRQNYVGITWKHLLTLLLKWVQLGWMDWVPCLCLDFRRSTKLLRPPRTKSSLPKNNLKKLFNVQDTVTRQNVTQTVLAKKSRCNEPERMWW